jgi:hypothetical protein
MSTKDASAPDADRGAAGEDSLTTGSARYIAPLRDSRNPLKGPDFGDVFRGRTADAGTRAFMLRQFCDLAKAAFAQQGMRAFENTKRATAIHEAGHVVIAIMSGRTVERVWIKRRRVGDAKFWIGRTLDGFSYGTTPDSPVEADVAAARSLIAGVLAEWLFDRDDFRRGSSLNEVISFQVIVDSISNKTGEAFEIITQEIARSVFADLDRHRHEVEAIAAALMARGELKTASLMQVIKRARTLSARQKREEQITYRA